MGTVVGGSLLASWSPRNSLGVPQAVAPLLPNLTNEDIFAYINRHCGKFQRELYLKVLGSANEFKEGDQIVGVSAANTSSREIARALLANTHLRDLAAHPPWQDELSRRISPAAQYDASKVQTIGQLKQFLLSASEPEIHAIKDSLASDAIACVVKLMSNEELIAIGAKVFNPLPNSKIGAKGYLGARVQPNSPTDNLDDIRWHVLDAFAYAVGDVLLGTNPVSSDPESVAAIELAL